MHARLSIIVDISLQPLPPCGCFAAFQVAVMQFWTPKTDKKAIEDQNSTPGYSPPSRVLSKRRTKSRPATQTLRNSKTKRDLTKTKNETFNITGKRDLKASLSDTRTDLRSLLDVSPAMSLWLCGWYGIEVLGCAK